MSLELGAKEDERLLGGEVHSRGIIATRGGSGIILVVKLLTLGDGREWSFCSIYGKVHEVDRVKLRRPM